MSVEARNRLFGLAPWHVLVVFTEFGDNLHCSECGPDAVAPRLMMLTTSPAEVQEWREKYKPGTEGVRAILILEHQLLPKPGLVVAQGSWPMGPDVPCRPGCRHLFKLWEVLPGAILKVLPRRRGE